MVTEQVSVTCSVTMICFESAWGQPAADLGDMLLVSRVAASTFHSAAGLIAKQISMDFRQPVSPLAREASLCGLSAAGSRSHLYSDAHQTGRRPGPARQHVP